MRRQRTVGVRPPGLVEEADLVPKPLRAQCGNRFWRRLAREPDEVTLGIELFQDVVRLQAEDRGHGPRKDLGRLDTRRDGKHRLRLDVDGERPPGPVQDPAARGRQRQRAELLPLGDALQRPGLDHMQRHQSGGQRECADGKTDEKDCAPHADQSVMGGVIEGGLPK